MQIEIKSRGGAVLFATEAASLREALEKGIAADADLADANLAGAYLARANLAGANLADADLADANRSPEEPQKTEAERRADFETRRHRSREERMRDFRERNPTVPVVEHLDLRIVEAIESGGSLDMSAWHSCETTHCRAGWAITLAGAAGKELERRRGPFHAGRLIYLASTGRSPHFFATNDRALEDLRKCAAEDVSSSKPSP